MLSTDLQSKLTLNCYSIVGNSFASFHNKINVGSEFSWEKFPTMMARHCETATLIGTLEESKPAARNYVSSIGFQIAEALVKNAGYV